MTRYGESSPPAIPASQHGRVILAQKVQDLEKKRQEKNQVVNRPSKKQMTAQCRGPFCGYLYVEIICYLGRACSAANTVYFLWELSTDLSGTPSFSVLDID
jgi:hypothetical protein